MSVRMQDYINLTHGAQNYKDSK